MFSDFKKLKSSQETLSWNTESQDMMLTRWHHISHFRGDWIIDIPSSSVLFQNRTHFGSIHRDSVEQLQDFVASSLKTELYAAQFYFRASWWLSDDVPLLPCLQEDSDPLSPLPSSGQKVSYQTDPRPHFGVAWSSHSTCRPLWGGEGPCWGQRNEEVPDQTHTCPHCHLGLPPDTLRWHEVGTNTQRYSFHQTYQSLFQLNREPLTVIFPLHRQSVCCSRASGAQRNKWSRHCREMLLVLFKEHYCLLWVPGNKLHLKVKCNICFCSHTTICLHLRLAMLVSYSCWTSVIRLMMFYYK